MNQMYQNRATQISIIVPVYNTAPYLEDCIDSVLTQTLRNLELILVNDGSHDNSKEICEKVCEQDSRVHLITYDGRKGPSYARNQGIDASTGKYLFFLDSDDMIHPQLLENMWKQAENFHADLVVSSFARSNIVSIEEWNNFCKKTLKPDWQVYENDEVWEHWNIYEHWSAIGGKLYLRKTIGSICFNEKIDYSEDRLFNYMVLIKQTCKVLNTNTMGYYYTKKREGSVCDQISFKEIHMSLQTYKWIRDNELRCGRTRNAYLVEDAYVNELKRWAYISKNSSRKEQQDIKVAMNKEQHTHLFQTLSIYKKFTFWLCKNFWPVYYLFKIIKDSVYNRNLKGIYKRSKNARQS